MAARIKLADIAREAGVSVTTVSFYINGKARQYKLSRQTCERIQAAIDRNDFVPNIFARALQCNRTYLIGLLVRGRINTSFWSDIVAGLEEKLAPAGFHLVLSSAHTDAGGRAGGAARDAPDRGGRLCGFARARRAWKLREF